MGADTGFAAELLRTIINSEDPSFFLQAMQGTKSWDDPVVAKGLDMMRQMQKDGIIGQDATSIKQYPEANNNFISGKAAIVQMGSWYAQYAKKDSMLASMEGAGVSNGTPFTMLPMTSPDFFGKGNVSGYFGETDYGMSINKNTKNLEASKTFVTWLSTTTNGQQSVANAIDLVPALKGVQADWNNLGLVNADVQIPVFKDLYTKAANPVETRNTFMSTETNNALVVAVQTALTGDTPSAEIIKQLETDAVDVPK
jgi:ABC-type glycerol-3-phosphate transport system substrate-binding protein